MISRIPVTSARSLDEAYALLAQRPNGLRVLAGGTDVMVQLNARLGLDKIGHVLDIWKVDELRGIRLGDDHLVLGALTTYSQLMKSPDVARVCPALAQVSREVGAWAIQNRGTIGGNVCNASPAGDTLPILMAAGARFRLGGPRGVRTISVDEFFVAYRKTALAEDELLLSVELPVVDGARLVYRKVGTRKAQSISKVILALRAVPSDGGLHQVRISAGCVAPVPLRCRNAEAALESGPYDSRRQDALRAALEADIKPIDDVRSTAEYRRQVAGNVLLRLAGELVGT